MSQQAESADAAVLEVVRELVTEVHSVGLATSARSDSSLERDLGLSSLELVELLGRLEERFGVQLPSTILGEAETPGDLAEAVRRAAPAGAARHFHPPVVRQPVGSGGVPENATTLLEALDWHARAAPEQVHIRVLGDEGPVAELTYANLLRTGGSVAAGQSARGISPGDTVALMLPTSPEYFTSFLGVLLAGAVPVPIYPPARPSQLEDHLRRQVRVLDNAAAVALVTVAEARSLARLVRAQVPSLTHVLIASDLPASGGRESAPVSRADDVALMQYTSGSTGSPKGVVLTHANLLANIRAMGHAARVSADDVFVSWLPLYHDMGLIGAWFTSLYFGIPLVVMSPTVFLVHPARWLQAIQKYGGTISGGPNFGYELCLRATDAELEGVDLSSWRIAFSGAEPVSARTVNAFAERFAPYGLRREAILPVYGLAETSVCLTVPTLGLGPVVDRVGREPLRRDGKAEPVTDDQESQEFVSCGQPLGGHEIRIVDATGRELGERREGRIEFRGPSATRGYFRNPEATARLIRDGWLDTGDLGYLVAGELYVTGRVKDLIIRAGRNIHPDELEEAVGNIPGIRKGCVAVFAAADPATGTERMVVLAETRRDAGAGLEEQINSVAIDLLGTPPDHVILAPAGAVLKTSSGKIRRSASRSLYEQGMIGRRRAPTWLRPVRLAWPAAVPQLRRLRHGASAVAYNASVWAFIAAAFLPALALLAVTPRRRWRLEAARKIIGLLFTLSRTPLVVTGAENLDGLDRFVVVANHQSFLDGFVLAASLPTSVTFVAGEVFARQHVAGFVLRRIGVEFVERNAREKSVASAQRVVAQTKAGGNLVFFPEGGLSRMPGLRPFHLGAFAAAATAAVPVVPVAISGTRSILRSDHRFFRRGAIHVAVGEPILASGEGFGAAARLGQAARRSILAGCGEPDLQE